MDVLIYGGGAVGLGIASCLIRSGNRVEIVARAETVAALARAEAVPRYLLPQIGPRHSRPQILNASGHHGRHDEPRSTP
jgi:ketopantoate reductase